LMSSFLQLDIVVGGHAVDAENLVAVGEEALGEMEPDETSRSGNEQSQSSLPSSFCSSLPEEMPRSRSPESLEEGLVPIAGSGLDDRQKPAAGQCAGWQRNDSPSGQRVRVTGRWAEDRGEVVLGRGEAGAGSRLVRMLIDSPSTSRAAVKAEMYQRLATATALPRFVRSPRRGDRNP